VSAPTKTYSIREAAALTHAEPERRALLDRAAELSG